MKTTQLMSFLEQLSGFRMNGTKERGLTFEQKGIGPYQPQALLMCAMLMCELGYVGMSVSSCVKTETFWYQTNKELILINPGHSSLVICCLSQLGYVWDNQIDMCELGYVGMSLSSCLTTETCWYQTSKEFTLTNTYVWDNLIQTCVN